MKKFFSLILSHAKLIFEWQQSDRLWQMPFFAALSVGIVLLVGSIWERPDLALVSMIGTTIFLYVPATSITHKMVLTMCMSFMIVLSFSFGLLTQLYPPLTPLVVGLVTMASAQIVRYFSIGAPGFFFFTFACILGSFIPFKIAEFPMAIGLVSIGTMVANFMVLCYALVVIYIFKVHKPSPAPKFGDFGFDAIIIDPVIIAFFVGFSMWAQELLGMQRGYWVSVSCATVLAAITFKSIWVKQTQRILGTFLGAVLAYYLLHFVFTPVQFALLMMALMFFSEILVVRNYALAIIFITPMTTYLAEASSFMSYDADKIITARVIDIIFGSLMGLMGGAFLHFKPLRRVLNAILKKIYFSFGRNFS